MCCWKMLFQSIPRVLKKGRKKRNRSAIGPMVMIPDPMVLTNIKTSPGGPEPTSRPQVPAMYCDESSYLELELPSLPKETETNLSSEVDKRRSVSSSRGEGNSESKSVHSEEGPVTSRGGGQNTESIETFDPSASVVTEVNVHRTKGSNSSIQVEEIFDTSEHLSSKKPIQLNNTLQAAVRIEDIGHKMLNRELEKRKSLVLLVDIMKDNAQKVKSQVDHEKNPRPSRERNSCLYNAADITALGSSNSLNMKKKVKLSPDLQLGDLGVPSFSSAQTAQLQSNASATLTLKEHPLPSQSGLSQERSVARNHIKRTPSSKKASEITSLKKRKCVKGLKIVPEIDNIGCDINSKKKKKKEAKREREIDGLFNLLTSLTGQLVEKTCKESESL